MNIFFLDDDLQRHADFDANLIRRQIAPKDIARAYDVKESIRILNDNPRFDVAFLDHDLNGQQMVMIEEGTGTIVARHIAAMPVEKRPRVVVLHSHNEQGAARMARILHQARVRAVLHPFETRGYFDLIDRYKEAPHVPAQGINY